MGRIVIVAYKPKDGKGTELKELIKTHVPRLRQLNLATVREPVIMETGNGNIIEVFEWVSEQAIRNAHTNPEVLKMWDEYAAICDYIHLKNLEETSDFFAEFTPVE